VTICFGSEVDEKCILLGYYAAYSSNSLPTFRDIHKDKNSQIFFGP